MFLYALCGLLLIALTAAVLCVGLSDITNRLLTGSVATVCVSFVLSAVLGILLTSELFKLPTPILFAATAVVAGAVMMELAQYVFVRSKAAVRHVFLAVAGVCLFVLSRALMHTVGMDIVDRFEVFLD